ncbi:transcriptional regulator, TetR family [Desulfotomaculum arcticum]|uniref:Transcriptional regulator, TetR family n=1 Tax=Desulfotruncus arcticus DSM 17038 TaxID=1121424 RepID=A0A1I2UWL2_9FIRM|nr:TetR/AcrR family transcriptional regulator [Desulfotruncus arcticus]SFG79151.1 transcriptional regulator, TetR family [Desulfotomaculum arcticum] [Desulfotruncus arcticus DSM 17038]
MKLKYTSTGNRYERKKEETRQKIIDVAMKLFYKQGFASTTLEQIAEEADIARKTLYNHFPVKEDIIIEYLHRFITERAPEIEQLIKEYSDIRSRLVIVLSRILEWTSQLMTKDIFRIYVSYHVQKILTATFDEILRSGAHSFVVKIIKLGQESGEIRRDLPLEIMISQADNIRVSAGMNFLMDPDKFDAQDYITKSVDLFLGGARDVPDRNR